MCPKTNDHLRKALVAILIRDGKKAAYWMTHFIIRMTEEDATILCEILGRSNGGWVQYGNVFHLSGCKCNATQVKKKDGTICRNFQPCPLHVRTIVKLLEQSMITTIRPPEKAHKQKKSQSGKSSGQPSGSKVRSTVMAQNKMFESSLQPKGSGVQNLIKVRKQKKKLVSKCCTTGSNSDIPRNINEIPSGLMPGVRSKDQ